MPSEPTHIFECPECGEKQEGKRGLYGHFQQNHPELKDDWENIKENIEPVEKIEKGEGEGEEENEDKKDEGKKKKKKGEEVKGTKKDRYNIKTTKSTKLGGMDLALAEQIINQGLAENLSDLLRKSIKNYALQHSNEVFFPNTLGGRMNPDDMKEMLSDSKNPMQMAMAYKIFSDSGNSDSGIQEMLPVLMGMNNGGMNKDDIFTMMMINQMNQSSDNMGPKEFLELAKELFQNQNRNQGQRTQGNQSMLPWLMAMQNKDNLSSKEVFSMLQQKEKEKTNTEREMLKQSFNNEINKLAGQVKDLKEDIDEQKEGGFDELLNQLDKVRKIASKLEGSENEEPNKLDAMERILDSVGQNFGPAVKELFKNQMGSQSPQPQPQPQSQPQQPQMPQTSQSESQVPESSGSESENVETW